MAPPKKVETQVRENTELFDTLRIIDDIDAGPREKPKLDIFKQVLPALNSGDYMFYSRLTDDEKKLYQPYVISRWLSGGETRARNSSYEYIQNTNEFVNSEFWSLTKHPELQHMLMCIAARLSNGFSAAGAKHQWLGFMSGKRKKSAINDFLLSYFPQLRDDELDLWKANTTVEEFDVYLRGLGMQVDDHKKYMKLFKDDIKAAT